jgi:hypothetical protein
MPGGITNLMARSLSKAKYRKMAVWRVTWRKWHNGINKIHLRGIGLGKESESSMKYQSPSAGENMKENEYQHRTK